MAKVKVTYHVESSFAHEDKDKEYPENVVVIGDFGEDGTQTVATITGTDVEGVEDLIKFIKNPQMQ